MLQRVVWNRVELRVSPPGNSDFTYVDDGILRPNEQAQRPRIRKKCALDHVWEERSQEVLRDLAAEVSENLADRKLANIKELGQI